MKGPLLLVNFLVVIGSLSTTTLAQEGGEQLEGIVIPLEKRQVLDSSNGVVDWARVQVRPPPLPSALISGIDGVARDILRECTRSLLMRTK